MDTRLFGFNGTSTVTSEIESSRGSSLTSPVLNRPSVLGSRRTIWPMVSRAGKRRLGGGDEAPWSRRCRRHVERHEFHRALGRAEYGIVAALETQRAGVVLDGCGEPESGLLISSTSEVY